ncbi:MAG: hypothetical protein M3Y56_16035, partial [Armatimonadota bacterium]|nr:hypothetical protein [Armatimonadota bacterium]
MSIITDMHEQAMDFTDQALEARRRGDGEQALELFTRALQEERAAAEQTPINAEPTRSVLYRSAATLALDAGMFREVERLIATALTGNPPPEIAEE